MKRMARAIAVTTLFAAGGFACGQAVEDGVPSGLDASMLDAEMEPLIVVDGVIEEAREMEELRALDIERIDVIKGEAAIEAYGDRGRNGVVRITTKDESGS